jgi:hypothetical protein
MDEMKEKLVYSAVTNAEYVHLIQDVNAWYIDYIIGVAFRTPINFRDKMNGLLESGRRYREFSDYKDLQDYLEEITGQEIVLESSMNPETNTEFDNKIVWETSEYRN